ncbi:MAG: hypothetical protein QXT73_00815 [Candidatus Methanomethylicaceae archaeon]
MYLAALDDTFRRCIARDPAANSLVAARIYPTYLASVTSPQYPCICYARQSARRDFRYNRRVTLDYDVYIYSSLSYAQLDAIFERLKEIFDNEWYDIANVAGRVSFRIVETPSQDFDSISRLYFSNFKVIAIAFFTN